MKTTTQINTSTIVRKFPEWAKVDRIINGVEIYNMNIFDNIMTFNQDNLDGPAFDYFGRIVTYGELPALREAYARGLKLAGVKDNGCNVRYSLGGGASEEGGVTLVTYFMDEETKTNETGKPLEPHVHVKLVDDDGNLIEENEVMGNLHATSPASADRYLDNPEATAERWYYDENGIKWGVTGDIAVRHADGSYTIMGRASDSYVDENGKRVYLFNIESSLDENDPINEWEISAFKNERGGYDVVGQVILDPDRAEPTPELVEYICRKYRLDAVKFYREFEIGEITAKRDYILLTHDYNGYYAPLSKNHMMLVSYSENGETVKIRVRKTQKIEICENYKEEN